MKVNYITRLFELINSGLDDADRLGFFKRGDVVTAVVAAIMRDHRVLPKVTSKTGRATPPTTTGGEERSEDSGIKVRGTDEVMVFRDRAADRVARAQRERDITVARR